MNLFDPRKKTKAFQDLSDTLQKLHRETDVYNLDSDALAIMMSSDDPEYCKQKFQEMHELTFKIIDKFLCTGYGELEGL